MFIVEIRVERAVTESANVGRKGPLKFMISKWSNIHDTSLPSFKASELVEPVVGQSFGFINTTRVMTESDGVGDQSAYSSGDAKVVVVVGGVSGSTIGILLDEGWWKGRVGVGVAI